MSSPAGNPAIPAAPFDIQMLFKQPNPNPTAPFPSSAPPPGPFYPPPVPSFSYQHQHPFLHYPQQDFLPNPHFHPPAPNPNPGARLMALLGTGIPSSTLESAVSMPSPSSMPSPFPIASSASLPELPLLGYPPPLFNPLPSAPPAVLLSGSHPTKLPSTKMPRGRRLPPGDRAVYDVDSHLPGELQPPQLEVTHITKYASDPGLVLGRQIAVNQTYICYALKQGTIRMLNINKALRSLLRGHTQRVVDMVFFAEDVHLLASASIEGRIFVWKINEGADEGNKPQITGKVIIAIQIAGDAKSYHPRVCWHPHKQEVIAVGISNYVLRIDTTKVGKGKEFSAEEPLICPFNLVIDGVQIVGKHDGEVTDLSMSQWTTRLVSASVDGTVKIWEDHNALPLVILKPHDGHPVNSAAFLTSPDRPDHIVLLTAGPLNREVKIWVPANEEGWILPTDSGSWQCTQTLDLRSSSEAQFEVAFFNQVVVLSRASLVLLANAKKNTIYALHMDFGPYPAATCMDYIADFTVTMPILSLTGTIDCLSDGVHAVQIFCVQTQAIQQYALDLFQCLPPPVDYLEEKDFSLHHVFETSDSQGSSLPWSYHTPTASNWPSRMPKYIVPISNSESASSVSFPAFSCSPEAVGVHEFTISDMAANPSAPPLPSTDTNIFELSSSSAHINLDLPGKLNGSQSSPTDFERQILLGDCDPEKQPFDYSSVITSSLDVPSLDNSRLEESKFGANDVSKMLKSNVMFIPGGNTNRLITPFEILSGALSASESSLVSQNVKGDRKMVQYVTANNGLVSAEVEAKAISKSGSSQFQESDLLKKTQGIPADQGNSLSSQNFSARVEAEEKGHQVVSVVTTDTLDQISDDDEEVHNNTKDTLDEATESASSIKISQTSAENEEEQANLLEGLSMSTPSPYNSLDSCNESDGFFPSMDGAFSHLLAMQDKLNQIMTMQKEMRKHMSTSAAVPINKEGRRVEAALVGSMEKAIKANVDALWGRFQEENAKKEKAERDCMQQMTSLITNYLNKDLPAVLERVIKKEISAVGQVVARAANPIIEKSVSSAIADSFQRAGGDKAVNQLEKSVNSKLEATVARQIQAQFQTSGKQALQDGLRFSLESSAIPAFEKACNVMFEQVHAAFQKGMQEHTTAALQQVDSTHIPLAITLRDAINSTSSLTQNAANELLEGQRNLLALVAAGNKKARNPITLQPNNDLLGVLPEMLKGQWDPKKELTRLISERKFEEAFTLALQRSDVFLVSWLCFQVDLNGICSMVPLPLSQGVLLSLLQQLACDISNNTSHKVDWMRDIAVAINPTDPMITPHVRPIFEQVYSRLLHQRSIPKTTVSEATGIHITMHVINSLLMSCK